MDETIHINVGFYNDGINDISYQKVRVWPSILSSTNWLLRSGIPGNWQIQHGMAIMLLSGLALAVEGCVADLIIEQLEIPGAQVNPQLSKLDFEAWNYKKELYNKTFQKKLETYPLFDGIEILLQLRNNITHGRTYTEMQKKTGADEFSIVESPNKNYQKVREYLMKYQLIADSNRMSNTNILWNINTAVHFEGLCRYFLKSLIQLNESPKKTGIQAEFNLVYHN